MLYDEFSFRGDRANDEDNSGKPLINQSVSYQEPEDMDSVSDSSEEDFKIKEDQNASVLVIDDCLMNIKVLQSILKGGKINSDYALSGKIAI